MHYKIETTQDYVRVEVFGRETAEQTREYLKAVSAKVFRAEAAALQWLRAESVQSQEKR